MQESIFQKKTGQLVRLFFDYKPNKFPVARPRVVEVREFFDPSNPSTFDARFCGRGLPVHPVTLLTLMSGIGNEEETNHRYWTYRMIASTLHLFHPNGQVYTFAIYGGEDPEPKWRGLFIPAGRGIGRSMYIHQYSSEKWFELSSYFMHGEDGKYGHFVTCF